MRRPAAPTLPAPWLSDRFVLLPVVLRLVVPLVLFTAFYVFVEWIQGRALRAEYRDPPPSEPGDPPA